MTDIQLLLVEDNKQDQDVCNNAINDFNDDKNARISLQICETLDEAKVKLKESHFDGIIIDMKLSIGEADEGNQLIKQIKDDFNRIPIVIMTGTPNVVEQEGFRLVDICKKGDVSYFDIINKFWKIYHTGLTKIMGGKGEIEKILTAIFTNNLLPALIENLSADNKDEFGNSWIKHGINDSNKTEKALLRYTMNHLIQYLDNNIDQYYPEEMYIYPPVNNRIDTGCIVKKKDSEQYYIVMNPACDLAERSNGGCNTDRACLVEIQIIKDIFPNFNWDSLSKTEKKELEKLRKNKKSLYYHYLPETYCYEGGAINFRRIHTYSETEMQENFAAPFIQISAPFLKDIISRFSSYYGRQGQPDIILL